MKHWLEELDRLLRGELTHLPTLRTEGLKLPLRGITILIVLLGLIYGACMGTFALLHTDGPRWNQMLASMVKVPALFLLTLLITFPSLYVFNALVGSQLRFMSNIRLLVGSLGVTLAVLASLGPIVAFFSVSTTSYPFMKLMNVLVFAVGGMLGMKFLLQTLNRMSVVQAPPTITPTANSSIPDPLASLSASPAEIVSAQIVAPRSPLDPIPEHIFGNHVKVVFRCWALVFGLVGAQMGWVLRPFIGNPKLPFTWFRPRDSNFFEAILNALRDLFTYTQS